MEALFFLKLLLNQRGKSARLKLGCPHGAIEQSLE